MYLIQQTVFLILLLHQCIVNSVNIFEMDTGFNLLNREINSITSSLTSDTEIMTRWILQELDHFNLKDKRKWHMKYFESLRFWRENGPIYLFLGGEGPASDQWARTGIMNELAKETYGAMYITEHRYYGDSKPFINLDAENMKYLSSRQALADIAKLISYLKSLPMYRDSKVVVIGGSYAGNLAAWMKVLYPTLIDAAISSSAPVLAQKDFFEFLEKIKDNFEHYGGKECLNKIRITFLNYDSLFQSPEGIKQFKKDKSICDACDITILENQQLFFYVESQDISSFSENVDSIEDYCSPSAPTANDKNNYSRFLNKYSTVNNSDRNCICYNFQEYLIYLKEKIIFSGMYPWTYQTCTEFGYFQTTNSKDQPFLNIPLEFYIKICSSLFGNSFNENRVDEGVDITNKLYGGLKPNVTKVVFTNGDMDSWSTISVLKDLSHDAQSVVIPRASHCQDLFSSREGDSEELKEARKYVKYLIKKWIGADKYLN